MIDFLHEREQASYFAVGKPLTGKPIEIMPGQVSDNSALVFAKRHLAFQQQG